MAMDFRLFTHNEEVFMNIRAKLQPGPFRGGLRSAASGFPCQCGQKKIVMRYSHSSSAMVKGTYYAGGPRLQEMMRKKATNGRVDVQIYPGSQLGGEERSFQDIQQGVIQIAFSRGQQRDGVQPLNGRVRPAVHVHQL